MTSPEVCVCYLVRETAQGRGAAWPKKTGFGRGKLVGGGGKLEIGESPTDAAVRRLPKRLGWSSMLTR
ncbi:MAG: hypothetical protein KF801_01665 [Cryobacterium sp.]|nr:hypothetical protein [Cryobacterium sp.]